MIKKLLRHILNRREGGQRTDSELQRTGHVNCGAETAPPELPRPLAVISPNPNLFTNRQPVLEDLTWDAQVGMQTQRS
jgi:hypothetical protein